MAVSQPAQWIARYWGGAPVACRESQRWNPLHRKSQQPKQALLESPSPRLPRRRTSRAVVADVRRSRRGLITLEIRTVATHAGQRSQSAPAGRPFIQRLFNHFDHYALIRWVFGPIQRVRLQELAAPAEPLERQQHLSLSSSGAPHAPNLRAATKSSLRRSYFGARMAGARNWSAPWMM